MLWGGRQKKSKKKKKKCHQQYVLGDHRTESRDIVIGKRQHFITFCPLEGHPRGHFITFYLPLRNPRGHFHCGFSSMGTPVIAPAPPVPSIKTEMMLLCPK